MKDFLFPLPNESKASSFFLLALRIVLGLLLVSHGLDKLYNYTSLCFTFPDPVGIGKELSLLFAIFGELFCSIAFVFGALYRLCMIPMIVIMAIAFFHIHGGSLAGGELALSYLILFVLMYVAGPGKYSIDAIISYHINKDLEDY